MARIQPIKGRVTKKAAGTDRGVGRKQITLVLTSAQFKRTAKAAKEKQISFAAAVRVALDKTFK